MKGYSQAVAASQQSRPVFRGNNRLRHLARSIARALNRDWHTHKYAFFAALLVLFTTIVVLAYYLNHPQPELKGDTQSYLDLAQQIQTKGQLIDPNRVPGFPLLIVLVFALTGQGNLIAVSVAHALLFILATLEIYVLAALILRWGWAALLIGLLVGANVMLLMFIKPIVSETLSLWLLVSLALAAVLFVYRLQARYIWLVTGFTLALFFTRVEWIYVPVPLFAYLLLAAARLGSARRMLIHILGSVLLLYAFLGCYIYINATQNHFTGVTDTSNINSWGKVVQYNMQDEAPPQYEAVMQIADRYLAQGVTDPRYMLDHEPSLERNYYALAGAYAQSIIQDHPTEFLTKSGPLALSSLTYVWYDESQVDPAGPFSTPLLWLQSVFQGLYECNRFFPVCALLWFLLLCLPRTARLRAVQAMGLVVLLVLYGLILTTVGGFEDYMRLHIPFSPLLIFVVWGSPLACLLLVVGRGRDIGLIAPGQTSTATKGRPAVIVPSSRERTGNILVTLIGGIGVFLRRVLRPSKPQRKRTASKTSLPAPIVPRSMGAARSAESDRAGIHH